MRLTQFSDFGLRVLIHAATTEKDWLTIAETAESYGGLSVDHVAKVVRLLGKEGWLEVRRGRGGGFRLAAAPEELRIGDVVRALEPDFHLVECFDQGRQDCPLIPICGLTRPLAQARDAFLAVLDQHTLAQVVGRKRKAHVRLLEP